MTKRDSPQQKKSRLAKPTRKNAKMPGKKQLSRQWHLQGDVIPASEGSRRCLFVQHPGVLRHRLDVWTSSPSPTGLGQRLGERERTGEGETVDALSTYTYTPDKDHHEPI